MRHSCADVHLLGPDPWRDARTSERVRVRCLGSGASGNISAYHSSMLPVARTAVQSNFMSGTWDEVMGKRMVMG